MRILLCGIAIGTLSAALAQGPRPRPAGPPPGGFGAGAGGEGFGRGRGAAGESGRTSSAANGNSGTAGGTTGTAGAMQTQPQLNPEDYGLVSGQLTSTVDGAPLRKATLTLRRSDNVRREAPQTVSTGEGGVFLFDKVAPGRYRLHAERNGFVGQDYGARRPNTSGQEITVAKSQKVTSLQMKLMPHGVVTGHVTDEDGEAMANVRVQLLRWAYSQGKRTLVPMDSAATDDRGEYRIFGVAPGKYVAMASSQRGMRPDGPPALPMLAAGDTPASDETYVPVYYPNSFDPSQASAMEVQAGASLQAVDFSLRKQRTVRVRGRVVRASDSQRPLVVMLMAKSAGASSAMNAPRAMTNSQGIFEIKGVRPGSYNLHAEEFDRQNRLTADAEIEVGPGGLDGVTVALSPGVEVTGSVKVEEAAADFDYTRVGISLRTRNASGLGGPFGGGANVRVGEGGAFKLTGVGAGEFDIGVTGLPEGYYLKSIRAGDQETVNTGLKINAGAAPALTVVASPNAATVEGMVKDKDQQPVQGSTVVLWPLAKGARAALYKRVTTTEGGRFTIGSVPPGEYRLAAFELLDPGAESDPEFLATAESKSEKLTIAEKARESKTLVEIVEP